MAIFTIADLHLGLSVDKPMSVFGPQWDNHVERLKENWWRQVKPHDTVLILGDISWGISLEESLADLKFIDQLPGEKILLRGNHDFWWTGLKKMRDFCEMQQIKTLKFLQNDAYIVEDMVFCGTRGWVLPGDKHFMESDEKIYKRELERLTLSLNMAKKIRGQAKHLMVGFHYPPVNKQMAENEITAKLDQIGADICAFGHIHSNVPEEFLTGFKIGACRYYLNACEKMQFILREIRF